MNRCNRSSLFRVVVCVSALGGFGLTVALAAEPKYSISDVMKKAHKGEGALIKKVTGGKGTKEDASQLLELYQALAANKPPRGEQADWDTRTAALIKAAESAVKGDPGAADALKAAADCKACHTLHRPD
jgi:hypothetical protein